MSPTELPDDNIDEKAQGNQWPSFHESCHPTDLQVCRGLEFVGLGMLSADRNR
jgi:hypothetical protein